MLSNSIKSWKLEADISIHHLSKFESTINDYVKREFDNNYPILRWRDRLDENQQELLKKLDLKKPEDSCIDIGLFKGEELIGWSYGWPSGFESACYYMANSCVLKHYRQQGFYQQMLEKVVQIAKDKGYQTIKSRHVCANNPVIVAKLKNSFHITGTEFSEIHGNLLHLTYFLNELRHEAYLTRAGFQRPKTQEVADLFLNS